MTSLLFHVGVGVVLGAAVGYFGQCSSGTCPLTSTWWRGALYGGFLGLAFFFMTPRTKENTSDGPSRVREVNDAVLTPLLETNQLPMVIQFHATWCGPCRQFIPTVNSIADEFAGRADFVRVNVEKAPEAARRWNVQSVPTTVVFKEGKTVDTFTGALSLDELRKRLERVLGTAG